MKKDLKKKTKSPENIVYSDKEMKRYLGALNEMHSDNLKGMREGFQIINVRFDRVDEKLDQHSEMIGVLMEDVSVLKEDVTVLKEDVSVLKEDVSVLKEDVSVIKEDVSILKDDMQIVKKELKKKVDYDEFLSLVQRVNKLEAKN